MKLHGLPVQVRRYIAPDYIPAKITRDLFARTSSYTPCPLDEATVMLVRPEVYEQLKEKTND